MITVDNYEAFALDYIEGTLDESTRDRFESFLLENQDLKQEIEECFDLKLSFMEEECCSFKEELYKDGDVDDLIISVCENVATVSQKDQLIELIKSETDISNELNIYKKVFLIPDDRIVCNIKDQLYKKVFSIGAFRYVATIAASLMLFFSIHQYLIEPNFDTPVRLSQSTPFNASFMPPKYIIECNLFRNSDNEKGINSLIEENQGCNISKEKILISTPTMNDNVVYSCNREIESMEYVQPIGVVFDNEISLDVIAPVDNKIEDNNEFDWNSLSASPQKNMYDVKDELDRPLVEEELPKDKKQKHKFFRKLKTNLVAISSASFN